MSENSGWIVRETKRLAHQFSIIFLLTYVLTFLVFPVVLWLLAETPPEGMTFWAYLWASYGVALVPAAGVFTRAAAISGVLIWPILALLKRLHFNRIGFALGAAAVVFVTGFIAVLIQDGIFVEGRSVVATRAGFSLLLSTTGAICALIAAWVVITLKIRNPGHGG